SIGHILKLADRFEISTVFERAEIYLDKTRRILPVQKLKLADQFRMDRVTRTCMLAYKSIEDMKLLKSTSQYNDFSDTTKAKISDRIMEL
ncbi:hypothetical protein PFISCL1PPCAC_21963, partial [Pristionchus fissidentatus]